MRLGGAARGRTLGCQCAVVLTVLLAGTTASAQSIQGTATYRERIALPPTAIFEAALEDASRADAPAEEIARTRVVSPGNPPIRFEIAYDAARIRPDHTYVVRARVLVDGRLVFTTDTASPVLTRGSGSTVSLLMRRVGADQTTAPAPRDAGGPALPPLPATFTGTLPCADCPGVRYQLNLSPDQAFFLRMTYEGRDTRTDDIGRWVVSSDGRVLMLKGAGDAPVMFALRDRDTLRSLNAEGDEITSSVDHDLKRSAGVEPLEPRLTVTGMHRSMADAGSFVECSTGRRMTVAQERANAALESAYTRARRQPGEEMKVVVEGRLAVRPNPDTCREQPALVVERVVSVSPARGAACRSRPHRSRRPTGGRHSSPVSRSRAATRVACLNSFSRPEVA
jgi:copper homeostasis protein (lipoprotein)